MDNSNFMVMVQFVDDKQRQAPKKKKLDEKQCTPPISVQQLWHCKNTKQQSVTNNQTKNNPTNKMTLIKQSNQTDKKKTKQWTKNNAHRQSVCNSYGIAKKRNTQTQQTNQQTNTTNKYNKQTGQSFKQTNKQRKMQDKKQCAPPISVQQLW